MPKYKSISFAGQKPFALKFSDHDPLFESVSTMSSGDVRAAIGCETMEELQEAAQRHGVSPHRFVHERLAEAKGRPAPPPRYDGWPAGSLAASEDARSVVKSVRGKLVLDPFAGRANYAAAAAQLPGTRALYCEISPVFQEVAEARNRALAASSDVRGRIAAELTAFAKNVTRIAGRQTPDELLEATAGIHFDARLADRTSTAFLSRLRTAIDRELTSEGAPLAAAAVVEALPRVLSDLEPERLARELRRELQAAALFVAEEPGLHSIPFRVASDATELAHMEPLGIDCAITNPPSLNFAAYTLPLAAWFLGLRRARQRRSRESADALGVLAAHDKGVRRAVARDVAAIATKDERMARIVANYFADMAEALAACASQMTAKATFALEVKESRIGGHRVATPRHLMELLEGLGFEPAAVESERFQVMRRG